MIRLYSATSNSSGPMLIADQGTLTSVGDFPWAEFREELETLKEGESTVRTVPGKPDRTWRITRLPDFATNRVLFDEHAKEYVMVSNGKCVLDHSSQLAFRNSHGEGMSCQFAPSEAVALRPVIRDGGKVALAWTYRAVDPCDLRPALNEAGVKAQFQDVLNRRSSKQFVGRI